MLEILKSWIIIILILIFEYRNYLIFSKDEELWVKKEEVVVFRLGGVLEFYKVGVGFIRFLYFVRC